MGRSPCCEKVGLKKGPWTPEEDQKLLAYIDQNGDGSWRGLPAKAGLQRCGKSCRLRWINYLRPDIKRGKFSLQEELTIVQLHALLGNRWSVIAAHLPRRTDNEIKNFWNTHVKKKLSKMGIDPVTHKPKNGTLSSGRGLTHMVQWENARLEAESRLVRQTNLHLTTSNPHQTSYFPHHHHNKPPTVVSPPPLPPLDHVLKPWQALPWPHSSEPNNTILFPNPSENVLVENDDQSNYAMELAAAAAASTTVSGFGDCFADNDQVMVNNNNNINICEQDIIDHYIPNCSSGSSWFGHGGNFENNSIIPNNWDNIMNTFDAFALPLDDPIAASSGSSTFFF